MPVLKLGDVVPNFDAQTTEGKMNFHSWLGGSWAILFSHPADYTPVCTTELGRVQKLVGEFQKRGMKVIISAVCLHCIAYFSVKSLMGVIYFL